MASEDARHEPGTTAPRAKETAHTQPNISSLVSQYQTSIGIQSLLALASDPPAHAEPPEYAEPRGTPLQNTADSAPARRQAAAPKQAKFSKTAISSLINLDESTASPGAPPEKRKRASPKSDPAAKKPRADPKPEVKKEGKADAKKEGKSDTKKEGKADARKEVKADAKKEVKADAKKEGKSDAKKEGKAETKKPTKARKKTPEVVVPPQEKPGVHPRMTTEKSRAPAVASVPPPSFLAVADGASDASERPPVVALEIPLLDPKNPRPGQAEVVVNVLKLAEEKYGWHAVHPEARSALELMDDVLDDDDDADDDDDDEMVAADDSANAPRKKDEGPGKKRKQQTLLQSKANRKVGKYDYEDPFIDDAELQWEEEITTTKEGFFVFWGPLVDERLLAKKATGKSKK